MALGANGGLHMTQDDLLLLAHILALTQGVKLSTVSVWATQGSNPMLFDWAGGGPRLLDIDAGDRRDVVPAELATRSRMAERHTALGAA